MNFAAETHVDRSIAEPEAFLHTDILGTHTLLEVVRELGIARFLQVSTDEVYGSIEEGSFTEEHPLDPSSPYSASKAGGDLQVLAYHRTYGLPVLITRGSNTYGPHQYPEKLIPLFVTNALEGEQLPLYGDGLNVRDWLHADDHADAIAFVLEHGEPGEVYNIGGGNERTNREITAHHPGRAGPGRGGHPLGAGPSRPRSALLARLRQARRDGLAARGGLRGGPALHHPLVPGSSRVVGEDQAPDRGVRPLAHPLV